MGRKYKQNITVYKRFNLGFKFIHQSILNSLNFEKYWYQLILTDINRVSDSITSKL